MELFKKEKHFLFTLHFSSKQMDILNVNKYYYGLKNEHILLRNIKKFCTIEIFKELSPKFLNPPWMTL